MAGTKPNAAPVTHSLLSDQTSLINQLFYYRFPADAFLDPDGSPIYLLVSQADGSELPPWLSFEEVTGTLSGVPNPLDPLQNVTEVTEILVLADDHLGGQAYQRFNITLMQIAPVAPTFTSLIVVSVLTGAFLIVMAGVVCRKRCRK